MPDPSHPELPIACDLGALTPAGRSAHPSLVTRVLGEAPFAVDELPDGLAFRFDEAHYAIIVELIAQERRCCPFFRFVLEVTPQRGPLWLRITGPPEGRTILRTVAGR
jgi:hypothetical protein